MTLSYKGATQQFNGREGETATLFGHCPFSLSLRGGGFAPRHLSRYVASLYLEILMIDTITGDLFIESVPSKIGVKFTRQNFFSSLLAQRASVIVKNEPYCSFSVGSHEILDLLVSVSLWFFGEQLEFIELIHHSKELDSSWADWSKDKEIRRKQIHDDWLLALTGNATHSYEWGGIWSEFDAKTGGSSIIIRYSW